VIVIATLDRNRCKWLATPSNLCWVEPPFTTPLTHVLTAGEIDTQLQFQTSLRAPRRDGAKSLTTVV